MTKFSWNTPTLFNQFPFKDTISALARPLMENLTGIRQLNDLYESIRHQTDDPGEFARLVLKKLGVSYSLPDSLIQELKAIEGPLVLIANHPFGGVEAFVMLDILSRIREDYRLVSSPMLSQVEELSDALIYVNPFNPNPISGAKSALQLSSYLEGGGALVIFPVGEAAESKLPGRSFEQQEWHPGVARLIQLTKASVVPVYFHGRSSLMYQLAGILRPSIRKSMQAREFLDAQGKNIKFRIGKKIAASRMASFETPQALNLFLQGKISLLSLHFLSKSYINVSQLKEWIELPEKEESIIAAADPEKMASELAGLPADCLLADSAPFQVWAFQQKQCPTIMREIGRTREITFREIGEGSGKSCDVDEFDQYYYQLLLWDKEKSQVAGGYRIGKIDEILKDKGVKGIYLSTLFEIKDELLKQVQPALELGRSYICKEYQRSYQPLMLLWTGISRFVLREPKYRYLLGPVSISAEMNNTSKTLLVNFLEQHESEAGLMPFVKPRHAFKGKSKAESYCNTFSIEDLRDVQDAITELEENQMGVPVLFKHYLKMGAKMLAFNVDPDFSDVLDCLMMTDLLQTDTHTLSKYMSKEGIKTYYDFHGK